MTQIANPRHAKGLPVIGMVGENPAALTAFGAAGGTHNSALGDQSLDFVMTSALDPVILFILLAGCANPVAVFPLPIPLVLLVPFSIDLSPQTRVFGVIVHGRPPVVEIDAIIAKRSQNSQGTGRLREPRGHHDSGPISLYPWGGVIFLASFSSCASYRVQPCCLL